MARIAELLAARAHLPLDARDADVLRTLTLTNIAAGVGELGTAAELLRALPLDITTRTTDAAFVLAAQLHARTQDDFYPEGRVHVGAITLAVTLALAEHVRDRTFECLAGGYRVLCAVAAVHSAEAQRRGMRPSGVFGPFGAAACAAIALGLDQTQTANAIALAAAGCAGHNQAWIAGSDEWLLEVGAAARAGLEAALFTRAGATAAPDAFEGRSGWASALFDEPGAMTLASSLETGVLGPEVVAIKPYPVSGIAQVPTSLACALHDEVAGEPIEDIRDIRVHISPIEHAYPGSANRGPFVSRSSALMSVAFCVACGICDGAVRLERLEHPGAPDLAGLLDRVRVEPDTAIPENEARVEVRFAGGREERRTGRAAEILFPPWDELCADGDAVARRSEADPSLVTAARTELAKPAPGAVELRRLLGERS